MKLIYTASLSLLAVLSFASCGGNDRNSVADSVSADSIIVMDSGDYSTVLFKSTSDVSDFLDFKKFTSPDGYIAFHGQSGVIDSEGFSITDIKVTGDRSAEIRIHIPKGDLSGRLLLKVEDSDATILDEEEKTTYKLQPLTIKK